MRTLMNALPASASRFAAGWILSLCAVALTALSVGTALGQATSGVTLTPHVARYTLNRHRADADSGISAVKGRMEVRFEMSCDGFRVEQYLGFRMLSDDNSQLEHLAFISSFEGVDGRDYWFNTKTYEDRKLVDEIAGQATVDNDGGKARYSRPSKVVEALPKGTLYPIRHMKEIIAAARSGHKSIRRTVFDGSTRENPFEISTFIGEGGRGSEKGIRALEGLRFWPVRLAYFSVGAVSPTPQFQMSADLYENGVIGNMVYDYGNFAIGVEIEEVETLPRPEC